MSSELPKSIHGVFLLHLAANISVSSTQARQHALERPVQGMATNSDPASAADMRNTNYNLLLDDAMPDKL